MRCVNLIGWNLSFQIHSHKPSEKPTEMYLTLTPIQTKEWWEKTEIKLYLLCIFGPKIDKI